MNELDSLATKIALECNEVISKHVSRIAIENEPNEVAFNALIRLLGGFLMANSKTKLDLIDNVESAHESLDNLIEFYEN